jgi:predicted dehydrogenase
VKNVCHAQNIFELAPYIKNIYLEKPFVSSRREREDIERFISDAGAAVIVGHAVSMSKDIWFIQQKAKDCGKLVKASFARTLARKYKTTDWRTESNLCPGGVIAQLDGYLFNIAIEILGDFVININPAIKNIANILSNNQQI